MGTQQSGDTQQNQGDLRKDDNRATTGNPGQPGSNQPGQAPGQQQAHTPRPGQQGGREQQGGGNTNQGVREQDKQDSDSAGGDLRPGKE